MVNEDRTMRLIGFMLMLSLSISSQAFQWKDLWVTKNQQGKTLLEEGKFREAEQYFKDPAWKATAAYRSGNYQLAAKNFINLQNELGFYNAGNAFAKLANYPQALKAYNKALALNPNNKDARYNRQLIEQLLKKSQASSNKQQPSSQPKPNNTPRQQAPSSQGNNPQPQPKKATSHQATGEEKKEKIKHKHPNSVETASDIRNEKAHLSKQWLKLIPDDPGGLMREKFLRDHLLRQRGEKQ